MSLRLQINLIIAVLMSLFIGTVVYQLVQDTRSSVREEIEGSNQVATQLFTRVSWVYEVSGLRGMLKLPRPAWSRAGQRRVPVRPGGHAGVFIAAPQPTRAGATRRAGSPAWYHRCRSAQEIRIGDGRLVVQANSSRAVLDGWDTLSRLLWIGAIALAVINAAVFWLTGRVLQAAADRHQGPAAHGAGGL